MTKQDVEGLGRDGQVVTVKPGRARNHLVPGKMAAYASPERLAQAEKKRAKWEVVEVVDSGLETAIKVRRWFFSLFHARFCKNIFTNHFAYFIAFPPPLFSSIIDRFSRMATRQRGDELLLFRTRVSEGITQCLRHGIHFTF